MVIDARPRERLVKIACALKVGDEICEAAADSGGIEVRARHAPAQPLWPVRPRRGEPPDDVRSSTSSASISLASAAGTAGPGAHGHRCSRVLGRAVVPERLAQKKVDSLHADLLPGKNSPGLGSE